MFSKNRCVVVASIMHGSLEHRSAKGLRRAVRIGDRVSTRYGEATEPRVSR